MLNFSVLYKVIGVFGLVALLFQWGVGEQVLAMESSEISKEREPSLESRHLSNIRQITFGGRNAEAYFSFDGDQLIFQSTREAGTDEHRQCYQIYMMRV